MRKGHIHALVAEDESIGDLGASATPGWIAHELFHAQDASQAAKEAKRFVPPQRMERVAASLLRRGFVLTLNAKNTPCVNYSNVCDAAPGVVVLLHRRCNVVKHAMSYCAAGWSPWAAAADSSSSPGSTRAPRSTRPSTAETVVGWRPGMNGRATRNATGYVIPRAAAAAAAAAAVGLANCSASSCAAHPVPEEHSRLHLQAAAARRPRGARHAAAGPRDDVRGDDATAARRRGRRCARARAAPPTAAERRRTTHAQTSSDDRARCSRTTTRWRRGSRRTAPRACWAARPRRRRVQAVPNPWPDVPCKRRGFRGLADLSVYVRGRRDVRRGLRDAKFCATRGASRSATPPAAL